MTRPHIVLLMAAALGLLLSVSCFQTSGDEQIRPVSVEQQAGPKPKDLRPFMHSKLVHSGKVFEGLVRRDFEMIRTGAEALKLTTLRAPQMHPGEKQDDEVFEHFRLEFVRLSSRLEQLAEAENLEGSAYVSEQLNGTCISCHQYVRDWTKSGSPRPQPE